MAAVSVGVVRWHSEDAVWSSVCYCLYTMTCLPAQVLTLLSCCWCFHPLPRVEYAARARMPIPATIAKSSDKEEPDGKRRLAQDFSLSLSGVSGL